MMHYRRYRKGERMLYGTIERCELETPKRKSNIAFLTVRGRTHVGIYRLNTRWLPEGLAIADKMAFCMFTDQDGEPIRLYIGGRKVYPPRKGQKPPVSVVIIVKKLYVPYTGQASLEIITPWE